MVQWPMSRICSWQIEHTSFFIHAKQQKTKLWYDCQSTTFAFRDVTIFFSLFSLLQPSFFILLFFSFLIFIFWFEKWINRDWGREKKKEFCSLSIITCTLRFKIDCSYQNGIREIMYILVSTQHRTVELNFIIIFPSFYWFNCEICIFWATIYAYIKHRLYYFHSNQWNVRQISIQLPAIRAFYCNGKNANHIWQLIFLSLFAIQFFMRLMLSI